MKIKIDADAITATLIAERERQIRNRRGHLVAQRRYYYTVADYPRLLLVVQGRSLESLTGRVAVALFQKQDSRVVCDALPESPQTWREQTVTQCTIKIVDAPGRG